VKVIVAIAGRAPEAAKLATSTIPIVVMLPGDLVREGFVASLNRPGGNLTGVATDNTGLAAKRFSLLHEIVPQVSAIHALKTAASVDFQEEDLQRAGLSVGVPR
jgi:putative tryptophan/tyrosine transport system substrate-binding protein